MNFWRIRLVYFSNPNKKVENEEIKHQTRFHTSHNHTKQQGTKQQGYSKDQIRRYSKREEKEERQAFERLVKQEDEKIKNRKKQILKQLVDKIKIDYGFIADHMNTPLHNASNLLATMPSWNYFSRPTNTAFHNLLPCRPP